eukprot:CAMPEP_0175496236 /NCGR_PEP_ID=MMETSP0096-20121207/4201_1 /TAXON_ID=311494 /ORGANISM="Alexandrium monilatum, Strain CCMP3105" /LENGTH=181 /DNA_ID=CAMNT_0016798239 /DNA_START=177 /DNA_END=719 /DNA_ORIENTATION=-
MRVDEVGDGLVRLWNQENPSKQVKVGNVITKVNGSTEDMRGALAKAEILEVTFQTDEEIQEVPADPPVPKKKPKAWYTDTDTYFPVLVILGIVISFVTSFLLQDEMGAMVDMRACTGVSVCVYAMRAPQSGTSAGTAARMRRRAHRRRAPSGDLSPISTRAEFWERPPTEMPPPVADSRSG